MRKPNPKQPKQQQNELPDMSLIDMFCILSAWSGQPLDNVFKWKIPVFMQMWKTYTKEMRLKQHNG